MNHGPALLLACVVCLSACGDDGTPPDENASTSTTSPTTTSPTTTTNSTTTDPGTTGGTTTTATDSADSSTGTTGGSTSGSSSSSGGDDSSTSGSSGGSSSSDSSSGGSSSSDSGGSSSSSGMAGPCDAGDGPDFVVTNFGAADYVIDGVNDPTLTLVRGCSYTFDVNAVGHPFFVKTAPVTGVGSTYDVGVTNNGTQNGVITWDVPMGAPDTLFYICQFHAGMTGTIDIIDP